jgi:4-hydroxyacetophenone monooxygenase
MTTEHAASLNGGSTTGQRAALLEASDETIDDAVRFGDPMAMRGLLYQLTADEDLLDMEVEQKPIGNTKIQMLAKDQDIRRIEFKCAEFLKKYRDAGATGITFGPRERLPQSIRLAAGLDLSDSEIEMWIEQLGIDPFARGLVWKNKPSGELLEAFTVAVIGAGMGGVNAAVLLKNAGIPFFVIEKDPEVGGTWYENRYPGARVDSPSRMYTHVAGAQYIHPYTFSPRDINLDYIRWLAGTHGIIENITFNTEVKSVEWNDATSLWEIVSEGPEGRKLQRANAVISAVGFLSRPNLPKIDGADSFEGVSFHSARWPEDLDLTGKRVALIGTGATGYQTAPVLATRASHLYIFQRTPGWCFDVPGYVSPLPPQVTWLDRNLPYYLNFARFRGAWMSAPQNGGNMAKADLSYNEDPRARSVENKAILLDRMAFINRQLAKRPELVEKMIPPYPPLAARHILIDPDDNIYSTLNRDNVTLLSDPILKIGPKGLVLQNGEAVDVDVIVYATGFKANDFLWPMEVRGRNGLRVSDVWAKDGPRAYLTTMLPGFPNFFMIYGPNANNFGGLGIIEFEEMVTKFALRSLGGVISQKKRTIEVTADAYQRYNDEVDRCEAHMLYADPRAKSYYRNEFGRSATNNPIDIRRIWAWTHDPSERCGENSDRAILPHFGADLIIE